MKNNIQTILVTGANGQLGSEIKNIAPGFSQYQFLFITKEELAIDDFNAIKKYFTEHDIDHCINCAAYTAVDKAETERDQAFLINGEATGNLAGVCKLHNAQLIHISTDYVFDGRAKQPYKETDETCPVSAYGESKLKGEELALQNNSSTIIIRTSWVYSSYKNNFVKTMLRLMKEKESINVVNDQYGCPTYAADIAAVIMKIISSGKSSEMPGIYNYTNAGITNWYEFALAIKNLSGSNCIVNPVSTAQYPTAAKRPQYSVLDTAKIKQTFDIVIPDWKDSLQNCLNLLK
ncbi:MAG: dTDP-4-dehydrorhamnose reductase [Ferruginibacter sp.]